MITKVKLLTQGEAELTVELNQAELKKFLEEAGKELAARVKLDGFRLGRVPPEILRKKLGDQPILETALERAIAEGTKEALRREKLDVYSTSDLKILTNSAERLKYTLKLLLFPEVKLGPYRHLGIALNETKVTEKEIEEALDFIRHARAQWEEFKGPAAEGQRLEIDFEAKDQDSLIEGGKSENHPLVLGQKIFMPGFEEQLLGMHQGETRKFSLLVPEDYFQKNIAGRKLDFTVTLKSLKKPIRPGLDDRFAQSLGNFLSVSSLKTSIQEGIVQEKKIKEKEKARLQILEEIDKQTEIKVPTALIQRQLQDRVNNFDQSLHQRGMELGLYLAKIGKTEEELKKEWQPKAETEVRRQLIMRAISQRESLKVQEEEVEKAAQTLAERVLLSGGGQEMPDLAEIKERCREELLREKIWEFLEKNNLNGSL